MLKNALKIAFCNTKIEFVKVVIIKNVLSASGRVFWLAISVKSGCIWKTFNARKYAKKAVFTIEKRINARSAVRIAWSVFRKILCA